VDGLEGSEAADDFRDVMFLEQADRGDAGGTGVQAGGGVFERNASQCKHGDFVTAGAAESIEARWLGAWSIFLPEDRSEQGEVGAGRGRLLDLGGLVARHADGYAHGSVRV